MQKTEVYQLGFARGQDIGKYVPYIEKGEISDKNAARELGILEVTCLGDAEMLFYHWANEAESNDRDYSPFEFTAKELNDLEQEVEWDVWDVYNDAIQEGFKSVWDNLESVYRRDGLQ